MYEGFQSKGCELQRKAKTAKWATDRYNDSCDMCCLEGFQLKCSQCKIKYVHETVMKEKFGIDITKEEKA